MATRRELIDAAITLIADNHVFPDVAEKVVEVLRGKDYEHLADIDAFAAPDIAVPATEALDHALELARNSLAKQGN